MKPLVKKLWLGLGAVVLVSVLCEGLLRLFKPEVVGVSHQPCIYVKDELNGYAYRPNSRDRMRRHFEMDTPVFINSEGFHDVERPAGTDTGGLRIAAIGDSFTASLHVPVSNGWTQVLERELRRRRGEACEVRNLGMDGTGTDIQVRILKTQLEKGLRIGAVILAFYKNDVDDVAMGLLYREVLDSFVITYQDESQRTAIVKCLKEGRPAAWVAAAYRRSYFFRALYNLARPNSLLRSNFVGPKEAGIRAERRYEPRARLDQAFRDLRALSEQYGFSVLVAPVPVRRDAQGSMKSLTDHVSPDVLRTFSVVDVVPGLERLRTQEHLRYRQLFWKYDGHLNATGNRLFGLTLADLLSAR